MKNLLVALITVFVGFTSYSQLPYLNASTGNLEEFPIDKDTSMYGFYNNTLFKTDKNQNVIWAKNYSIISFSGLLISKTGSLFFYGDKHFGKMDLNGNIIWTKSIDAITTGTNTAIYSAICNRVLLDRNNHLLVSGSTQQNSMESGLGFILKTDTLGNFIKLRMINDVSSGCPSPSYGFQAVNDSSGFYKLIRFGARGSMCSAPQYVVCLSYNDNNDSLSNYMNLEYNSAVGYAMKWKIKKSKVNSDFYLHVDFRPGSMGNPLDITVAKYKLSGNNLWKTRLGGGPLQPFGNSATENYNGEVLTQLIFGINSNQKQVVTAFIHTNGATNGVCQTTYSYSGTNNYFGSFRLQSKTNNNFLQENILNNSALSPMNFMKIDNNLTAACVSTVTCSYSLSTGIFPTGYPPFCAVIPVGSNTITNISPTFTTIALAMNTTSCTMTNVGLNEYNLNNQLVKVHPNPASNILKLDLTNSTAIEEVHVLDVNGKNIKTHFNCKEISVSDLSPGVYFIQLKSEGQTYYSKFIKE